MYHKDIMTDPKERINKIENTLGNIGALAAQLPPPSPELQGLFNELDAAIEAEND